MSDSKTSSDAQPAKRRWSMFPKTMAQVIEPLTRPVLKSRGLAGTKLLSEWPRVVGEDFAERCFPEKLSFPQGKTTDGTLTIAVENGFSTEFQHLQPIILERLSTYFGYRAVSRIVISHGFVRPPAPATFVPPHKPLTPEQAAMVEEVEDPELKKALASLARSLTKPD